MKWFSPAADPGFHLGSTELVEVVSGLRHAHLNDLQVLRGWLDLGRVEGAIAYLGKITSRSAADNALHALAADLEAALLVARERAAGRGVSVTINVSRLAGMDYFALAAAGREQAGRGPDGRNAAARGLAAAVVPVVAAVVGAAADAGHAEVLVEVGAPAAEGCLAVSVGVPPDSGVFAGDPAGLGERVLIQSGFSRCGGPQPGAVGVDSRSGWEGPEVLMLALSLA